MKWRPEKKEDGLHKAVAENCYSNVPVVVNELLSCYKGNSSVIDTVWRMTRHLMLSEWMNEWMTTLWFMSNMLLFAPGNSSTASKYKVFCWSHLSMTHSLRVEHMLSEYIHSKGCLVSFPWIMQLVVIVTCQDRSEQKAEWPACLTVVLCSRQATNRGRMKHLRRLSLLTSSMGAA